MWLHDRMIEEKFKIYQHLLGHMLIQLVTIYIIAKLEDY